MRNVKLLWGTVIVLIVAVVVLGRLAMHSADVRSQPKPEQSPDTRSRIVAKIGNKNITAGTLLDSLYSTYGGELLGRMLDREAIRMEAAEIKLKVDETEIDKELKRMQQGYESEEAFYQSMKEQLGMTREELYADTYDKLLLEGIATHGIDIGEQQVDDYMREHPDEFKNTIQLHLQQIISDTQEQADKTYQLATGGADFSQLARERSLDTNTANDGGDLGWVDEHDPFLPDAVMKAARGLKPGEISRPIRLDNGYAVIKLSERKEQTKGALQELRESVRKQLALQQAPPLKDITQRLRQKHNASIVDPALAAR
jgi:foldase protein PrsA